MSYTVPVFKSVLPLAYVIEILLGFVHMIGFISQIYFVSSYWVPKSSIVVPVYHTGAFCLLIFCPKR